MFSFEFLNLDLSFSLGVILFIAALVAGTLDAIAGGGGLITIPLLLSMGITPTQALATNKLQACGGSFSASLYFLRKQAVDLKKIKFWLLLTFIGSAVGTLAVQHIEITILNKILPFLILAIGLYFLFSPKIGIVDRKAKIKFSIFAFIAACVGFYDGFFGPATGSFFSLALVLLLGFNLPKATAHAKVLNFTSNIASLIFFLLGGNLLFNVGIIMLVGQFIGAQIGASLVLSKGQKLIRPLIVLVSFLMTFKLFFID